MDDFWSLYAESAKTALGFFWKAGWAFVLGYSVSAMIQAFVPKARLTRFLGDPGPKSVALGTAFGAISSSCSFAALATARALLRKGAHFAVSVAFMFASTNLVIELGILIYLFLGWEFLVAEVVGGLVLIALSTLLIRLTYPRAWVEAARERLEDDGGEDEDFDWKKRITSLEGWEVVGRRFTQDWRMVWREIVVGFTIAGFVAVIVPASFWKTVFLAQAGSPDAGFWRVLESAAVAPFVAAATFIGSMGNIPLATVLNSEGVVFAGIMGFIYSDLMVPPLVRVNAKYYGWRIALYIAGVMYASIVATALLLHYGFALAGATPESARRVEEVARFAFDYTFFMNLVAAVVAAAMIVLSRRRPAEGGHGGGLDLQSVVTWVCIAVVAVGLAASAL